jgi:protoporphyrin/coproporphyrin ferrochelatase
MRPTFRGCAEPADGSGTPVGVLVGNLGTPDAPTPAAVRRFLAEFLADPRVVELSRPLWWAILHAFVLRTRPARSARLYERIWQPAGSPLLLASRELTGALAPVLASLTGGGVRLALGMRYGRPSAGAALRELAAQRCTRVVVLPLFPQYSSTTTGSVFDAVTEELSSWRYVPELRMVMSYCDDAGYVAALASSVREVWASGAPDRLMLSFHGLPKRYVAAGDPYLEQCRRTAGLLTRALGWPEERTVVSFQSRFGREPWIEPATDAALTRLASEGVRHVDVVCPGFATDCLETLEEIALTNRELFLAAGGQVFRYIPALGSRPDHVAALAALVRRQLEGWLQAPAD